MDRLLFWLVPIASVLALGFAWFFHRQMMKESEGTPQMMKIAAAVRKGAMSSLKQCHGVLLLVFYMSKIKSVGFFVLGVLLFFSCAKFKKEEQKVPNSIDSQSSICFSKKVFDFGIVKKTEMMDTLQAVFTFTNVSKDTVFIFNVEGSCDCMNVEWSEHPVPQNAEGKIKVNYGVVNKGAFRKTVIVETNNPNDITLLYIQGTIK